MWVYQIINSGSYSGQCWVVGDTNKRRYIGDIAQLGVACRATGQTRLAGVSWMPNPEPIFQSELLSTPCEGTDYLK